MKEYGIEHVIPKNTDIKACYAENAIFRLRTKLAKLMDARNTFNWIDHVQEIVNGLNSTFMKSIGMAPKDVNMSNYEQVYQRLYGDLERFRKTPKFKVGDTVRLSRLKGPFGKGTNQKFTEEVFTITKIIFKNNIPCYIVEDYQKEEIDAFFYEEELQRFVTDDNTLYRVDQILKTRTYRGKKQYFCSFKGYSAKFNQWINHSDLYPQ